MTYYQYMEGSAEPVDTFEAPTSGYYYKVTSDGVTLFDPQGSEVETVDSLHDLEYIVDEGGQKYNPQYDGFSYTVDPDSPLDEPPLDSENVEPEPEPVDPIPPLAEREDDTLAPGEKLGPDDSDTRSSITSDNGDYKLTLNADNELILTDADGNELWGYSGTDAADLLSSAYEVVLGDDGSIKVYNGDTVVRVIREGGEDVIHAKLVLLPHPEAASQELRIAIDEAQDALQLLVDCFGKGQAGPAEDVSEWLHNEGLLDRENTSSISLSYNESYLDYDTEVKNHFKDLDEKIRSIAVDAERIELETFTKITNTIDDLEDNLRQENVIERNVSVERPEDMSSEAWSMLPQEDKEYDRIQPRREQELFTAIENTLDSVEQDIADANGAMEANEETVDEESPEYEAGWEAGHAAALALGSGTELGTLADADYSGLYSDLIGGAAAAGLAGDTSGISSLLDSLISDIEGSEAGSAGTGNGGQKDEPADNTMSNLLNQFATQQMMSNLFNNDKESEEEGEEYYEEEPYPAEANDPGAQPNTTTPLTDGSQPAAVTAEQTTPPPVYAANTMVDMKLPDGSTQKVSSVVAQAVNKELNNPNGSDANAAYAGTTGASSAGNPWVALSGNEPLHTGDVVQWANRSALVVVIDEQEKYIIFNGQLVPFEDPNNPPVVDDDSKGAYGDFQGFYRPNGADLTDATDSTSAQPPSVPAPTTAPAPPPAVPVPTTNTT
ncbi:hypothetical protein ACFVMC_29440 [Nocardia sp. NPDC127579]|uniref:hypothetical protein n=1 Tax=Nocardia sp. NPDC127579 TaxID=3345402 RepID=UPI00362708F3